MDAGKKLVYTSCFLLGKAWAVAAVDSERGGVFTVPQSQQCIDCSPVCVEDAALCELHDAWLEDGQYTFTY